MAEPTGVPDAGGPAHGASSRPPRRREEWFYGFVRLLVLAVAKAVGQISVTGGENIPRTGAYVLAPVHRSNIDFALASLVTRRRMRYMGKDTIWKYAALGRVFTALGAFPVVRGTADRESMRATTEFLSRGEPVVIFPEGARKAGPLVQPLFDGPAYLACKLGVPIVPVGIGGSERVMPKGAKFVHRHKLALVIGPPLAPPAPAASGRVPRRAARQLTDQLRAEIQRLFDEAQALAGSPNDHRHDADPQPE
jgi:1-acyl-sn-glycerol-3-phosphate acyltransferase